MEKKIYRNPVAKYAKYYNMRHQEVGNAIIFNHSTFSKYSNMSDRRGTDVDRDRLVDTFGQMGFNVRVHENLSYCQIKAVFDEQSQSDHTNRDSIVFVFLTHGKENGEMYAYDMVFHMEWLFDYIVPNKCPTLTGKPKLFFVQACRGDKMDSGVAVQHCDIEFDGFGSKSSKANPFTIPAFTDFFISYATFPGFVSYRNPDRGSPYIQYLCEVFNSEWKKADITRLMTYVTQMVAVKFESNMDRKKLSPFYNSSLTRILKFKEKN